MAIAALSHESLGEQSFLKHWKSATGTKSEDYYSSEYQYSATSELVGVKLYDATTRLKVGTLVRQQLRECKGFIIAFSLAKADDLTATRQFIAKIEKDHGVEVPKILVGAELDKVEKEQ